MLKYALDIIDVLDDPQVSGEKVVAHLDAIAGPGGSGAQTRTVRGGKGSTDFVRVLIPGTNGATSGGSAPTLGVIGRLGGIGARPEMIGFVSDGDGAAAALSTAAKLLSMKRRGDHLPGDVIVTTHICPSAPALPHHPVPFMDSPVDIAAMNAYEVDPAMDAVLSIDTTKGNRLINHRGVALSPTVKEGYILRVSDSVAQVVETVTGEPLVAFPITTQDITPYGNGVYHLNSILQPAVATSVPVIGLAIVAATAVAGCATGASHEVDIAAAARVAVETAKGFGSEIVEFYDQDEFDILTRRYGSLAHLQTLGQEIHESTSA
ncbi:DUF1177 domain-containing protein [Paramicrobacterium sp. CJ85]|uniref:DUF1177 domain-containing protein n=1 Tax=Paramicrobacterium sp. CJ85 TaxID=3445355 RepID=UPI003F62C977